MAEITVAQIGKLRQQTGAGLMDCKKALTETEGDVEAAIAWLRKKGAATAEKKSTRTTSEGVIALNITDDGKKGTLVEINCETDFVAKNDKFQEFCNEIAAAYSDNPEADLEEKRTTTVAEIGENIQLTRNESLSLDGPGAVASYIHHGAKVGVLAAVETGKDETTQTEPFKQLLNDITLQITAASPEALDRDALDQGKLEKEREIAREQFKDKPAQAIEKIVEGKIEKYYSEVCLVDQDFVKGEGSVKDHVTAVAKELGDEITIKAFIRFQVGENQED
ncbi:MAG: translation elongation factor Ts [Verrucomicrobiota bacterium]|nr:translation elongation factor Ts [Verrucomicrobiota bacterium]MEE2813907.1 translation elongation factor Ts [Verrucomicrobiota bacterium]